LLSMFSVGILCPFINEKPHPLVRDGVGVV